MTTQRKEIFLTFGRVDIRESFKGKGLVELVMMGETFPKVRLALKSRKHCYCGNGKVESSDKGRPIYGTSIGE